MPGRCSLSSSCSTGVMPCEASVDTSPVCHTFLKFAAPNSWRLWTYHAQVWMPGGAANSACGSQKVGISTDGRAPRNSLESPQTPAALAKRRMSASLIGPSGSSTFRLSINAVSMSLAGSCFSSESAPRPFHQGTSFHRSVELGFSPIGFDSERFSCGCRHLLPGPPELGTINPDAVHDHGQPARERHDRLLHPAAPGDLHGPRLEPGPFF